jgi:serine/threonine protein kinase
VKRATLRVSGRPVAVKVFYTPESQEAFRKSYAMCKVSATTSAPNLVETIGLVEGNPGDHRQPTMLVMEQAERSLQDILGATPNINAKYWAKWMIAVARGIASLHDSALEHLNIKPSNVLFFAADTVVKLGDFGLEVDPDHFAADHFVSPEQLVADDRVDAASDVYAFGMLLWCLVTGTSPWKGCGTGQIVKALADPSNTTLVDQLPADHVYTPIAKKCLQHAACDRPAMADVVTELVDADPTNPPNTNKQSKSAPTRMVAAAAEPTAPKATPQVQSAPPVQSATGESPDSQKAKGPNPSSKPDPASAPDGKGTSVAAPAGFCHVSVPEPSEAQSAKSSKTSASALSAETWRKHAKAASEAGGVIEVGGKTYDQAACLVEAVSTYRKDSIAWFELAKLTSTQVPRSIRKHSFTKTACLIESINSDKSQLEAWKELAKHAPRGKAHIQVAGAAYTRVQLFARAVGMKMDYYEGWCELAELLSVDETVTVGTDVYSRDMCITRSTQ